MSKELGKCSVKGCERWVFSIGHARAGVCGLHLEQIKGRHPELPKIEFEERGEG